MLPFDWISLALSLLGVIRNTEPLDYDKSHNHILSVVAYDCGMKRSIPVLVTIKVSRVCSLGWKGKKPISYFYVLQYDVANI